MQEVSRCPWARNDPDYCHYHDHEWGVPVHDDRKFLEMLILEGFQAGLSWITILKKRENFRKAFANWDVQLNRRAHCARNTLKQSLQLWSNLVL